MNDSILKRLERLEKQFIRDPIIVFAVTDTGESVKVSARECVERHDLHFDRVDHGSDLNDLDLLIAEMRRLAEEGAENEEKANR